MTDSVSVVHDQELGKTHVVTVEGKCIMMKLIFWNGILVVVKIIIKITI